MVGVKMIWESRKLSPEEKAYSSIGYTGLLVLSLAISIDALAVGLTLPFINVSLITGPIIIGLVTFILSFLGTYLGNSFGHLLENKVEMAGGVILILIGCKILLEHT